jgi:shikimate kinase
MSGSADNRNSAGDGRGAPPRVHRTPGAPADRHPSNATGRHVVLVGLPGVGKTTVGRAVAERLGMPFLDFDAEIEKREGARVARIFKVRGERYFRALERELTAALAGVEPMVLAPGGGWVKDPVNLALLRPPSSIILLAASPETAMARMGRDVASRPLLDHPDPLATVRGLAESRRAAYESADAVVDTEVLDLQGVIDRVVELALHNHRE